MPVSLMQPRGEPRRCRDRIRRSRVSGAEDLCRDVWLYGVRGARPGPGSSNEVPPLISGVGIRPLIEAVALPAGATVSDMLSKSKPVLPAAAAAIVVSPLVSGRMRFQLADAPTAEVPAAVPSVIHS